MSRFILSLGHWETDRSLIDADRRGVEARGMVLWTLLTTELAFRTFFDVLAT